MNSSLVASYLVTLMLSTPVASAQTICIRVYNHAHVPDAKLNAAVLETTRLFKSTGVRITWQPNVESQQDLGIDMSSPAVARTDTRPYIVLTLLTRVPGSTHPGALGFALPFAQTGAHASIFYDRVDMIARTESKPQYVVLGHAMAHELAHVLLRSNEHSLAGLMQPRWTRATWQLASEGLLTFSPEQAQVIRQTARAIAERQDVVVSARNHDPATAR